MNSFNLGHTALLISSDREYDILSLIETLELSAACSILRVVACWLISCGMLDLKFSSYSGGKSTDSKLIDPAFGQHDLS